MDRDLWQAKLDQLERFAALTMQMDAAPDLDGLERLLQARQEAMAAVDRIDVLLAGAEPPADLRAAMQRVIEAVLARDGRVRQRLERALQERTRRLVAVARGAVPAAPPPSPRFLDQQV